MKRWSPLFGLLLLLLAQPTLARITGAPDPTRPATVAPSLPGSAGVSGAWHLGSVLVSDSRRVAVVNGEVVAEGDRVQGARVVKITERGVLLDPGGASAPVQLTLQTVKVRSNLTRMARAGTRQEG